MHPDVEERDVYVTDEGGQGPVPEGNCVYWATSQMFNARFMTIENFYRWMREESPWYRDHPLVRRPTVGNGIMTEALVEFLQSHLRVRVGNSMRPLSVVNLRWINVATIEEDDRTHFQEFLDAQTGDYEEQEGPGVFFCGLAFHNRNTGQYRTHYPSNPDDRSLVQDCHIVCMKNIDNEWFVYDSNSGANHPATATFFNTVDVYHYVRIWIILVRYM